MPPKVKRSSASSRDCSSCPPKRRPAKKTTRRPRTISECSSDSCASTDGLICRDRKKKPAARKGDMLKKLQKKVVKKTTKAPSKQGKSLKSQCKTCDDCSDSDSDSGTSCSYTHSSDCSTCPSFSSSETDSRSPSPKPKKKTTKARPKPKMCGGGGCSRC